MSGITRERRREAMLEQGMHSGNTDAKFDPPPDPQRAMSQWQPIKSAPVPKREELRFDRWRCLLQNKHGEVFEGYAAYVRLHATRGFVMRWYQAKECRAEPIYWQPLPEPRP